MTGESFICMLLSLRSDGGFYMIAVFDGNLRLDCADSQRRRQSLAFYKGAVQTNLFAPQHTALDKYRSKACSLVRPGESSYTIPAVTVPHLLPWKPTSGKSWRGCHASVKTLCLMLSAAETSIRPRHLLTSLFIVTVDYSMCTAEYPTTA